MIVTVSSSNLKAHGKGANECLMKFLSLPIHLLEDMNDPIVYETIGQDQGQMCLQWTKTDTKDAVVLSFSYSIREFPQTGFGPGCIPKLAFSAHRCKVCNTICRIAGYNSPLRFNPRRSPGLFPA